MNAATLVGLPVALLCAAALAPAVARVLRRETGYLLAALFAAGTGLLIAAAPGVIGGDPVSASIPWLPSAGMRLAFRLDALALLFSLLILGVGALVFAYSARYLEAGPSHGRLYGLLAFFAASMLGLVLADDVIALFVFWELTSISSFFLIGGTGADASRTPAVRAFLVTALGGIALLGGLILLSLAAGDTSLSAILTQGSVVREHAFAPAIIALVLLGAFTKSAQVPFHFWLPGAMVAPTPVSTYLHAATMVKAGIYLLARLSPIFAEEPGWRYPIMTVGLVTAVFGASVALKQHDLKALLAYSTVSQLGFLVALVGVGTFAAMLAAAAHTIAHAMYKATLFMVVGIIDTEAGSRDIRRLSGLRKMMPLTATVTGVAALSMAGLPPFLGFISKEEAFAAFLHAPGAGWVAAGAIALGVAASVMTFAYGARIFDGAFGGPPMQKLFDPSTSFLAPAAIVATAGLALGVAVPLLDPLVGAVSEAAFGAEDAVHLALWHGPTGALAASIVTVGIGALLFLQRRKVDVLLERVRTPIVGVTSFDAASQRIVQLGKRIEDPFLSHRPAAHLGWVLAAAAALGIWAWTVGERVGGELLASSQLGDWAIAGLLALALAGTVIARPRLAAVALIGIAGFVVATLYIVLGAPDLAITQLLIETLTVALVVLVFRRLPRRFAPTSATRRAVAALTAAGVGVLAALATVTLTGRRDLSEAGAFFLEAGPEQAGGDNVVNTILVDFRAFDTLGEIAVLAVAAMGVFAMVRGRRSQ